MTELCGCGTVEDACHRMFELWKKMLADDECPLFIYAQAEMFITIAGGAMLKSLEAKFGANADEEFKNIVGRLVSQIIVDKTQEAVRKDILNVFLEQKYEIRCQRAWTHNEERLSKIDHCTGMVKKK